MGLTGQWRWQRGHDRSSGSSDWVLKSNQSLRKVSIPFGKMLFELTGGHPGAALDVIRLLPEGRFSFASLLQSTHQAALDGEMSQKLIYLWSQLPIESRRTLRELILQRRIPTKVLLPAMDRLDVAEVIQKKPVGEHTYLDFRSWYVELTVWLHADELGIADEMVKRVEVEGLMPRTSTVCTEAFRLINEIENLARNFIAVHLSIHTDPGFHFLMGRARRFDAERQVDEDAYQVAEDWQNRSMERGLLAEINPLIAYLSTRDLASLIEELGAKLEAREWLRIAQVIRRLSDVRDAVMHNQLIGEKDLEQIYLLRADIYDALSKPIHT